MSAASDRVARWRSANVLILGDSFVSRLHYALQQLYLVDPRSEDASLQELSWDLLKAPKEVLFVYCHGSPGSGCTSKVSKPFSLPDDVIMKANPKYAILEIGGNDVDSPASPEDIARAKVELANQLMEFYDVRAVALSTILPRDNVRSMSSEQFRVKADETNRLTEELVASHTRISFHRHKGFWRTDWGWPTDTSAWSTDGIHPNAEIGMNKYKRAITAIMHNMLKTFHNSNPN